MINFWLETTKNIMYQWNDDEPKVMAYNIEKLVLEAGPKLSRMEWKEDDLSLVWIYDPSAKHPFSFTYQDSEGTHSYYWDWETSPNAYWSDDGKIYTTWIEDDGDAIIFGDHFTIFIEEQYKNGVI